MKILLATQKPFAAAAVAGIRSIVEEAGHELALLEKYAAQEDLEKAVADAGYTMYGDKKHTPKSHGKALRFTSDCPEVVKVLRDGTITAMKAGTATIYIQDISGKWCTMEVTVKEK